MEEECVMSEEDGEDDGCVQPAMKGGIEGVEKELRIKIKV